VTVVVGRPALFQSKSVQELDEMAESMPSVAGFGAARPITKIIFRDYILDIPTGKC
jgi:hypothetical protein